MTTTGKEAVTHSLLPQRAREILKQAHDSTQPDSLARRKAVDQAIERVQREYPGYFRQESGDDGNPDRGQ